MSDESSTINGPTALAHLILAGTAGFSLSYLSPQQERPFGATVLLFLVHHGLFGFVRYAYPQPPKWLDEVLRQTSRLAEHILLPLINLELYMAANLPAEINVLHALSAGATTITQFAFKNYHRHSVDASMLMNIMSTLYVGSWHDNPWAVGLSALTAMNHFVFSRISSKVEVPKYDLIAIGTSFFALFSVKAINEFVLKTDAT